MTEPTRSAVIEDFIDNYDPWKHVYEKYAKAAKKSCESELEQATLPAIVTYRAKDKNRLLAKLQQRNRTANYRSKADIFKDIKDLAGVRIAVYFPSHKAEVGAILKKTFTVLHTETKSGRDKLPTPVEAETGRVYKKRFYDYEGDHYHVEFHHEKSPIKDKHLVIEIQVVTVISSAWSQVEHDIIYKKISGQPSKDEQRILDGFNGLVNMGELLLEQLHETYQNRIDGEDREFADREFADEFELGSYLRKWISLNTTDGAERIPILGPVMGFYTCLLTIQMKTPGELNHVLKALKPLPESVFSDGRRTKSDDHDNFSIYAVKALGKQRIIAEMVGQARQERSDSLEQDQAHIAEAIEILASTFMWLHEFFPRTDWRNHLFSNQISIEDKENLTWFLSMKDPGVAITAIWEDGDDPDKDEISRIQGLWSWLRNHMNQDVQLIFGLSCLGMRKGTSDIPQLRRIGEDLNYYGLLG